MPYQMVWEEHGVYVRFYGLVSENEIANFRQECQGGKCLQDIRYILNDYRECEGMAVTQPLIKKMAATDSIAQILNENLKIVIVTNSPYIREIADNCRNLELDVYQIRMFTETDDAREWLKG